MPRQCAPAADAVVFFRQVPASSTEAVSASSESASVTRPVHLISRWSVDLSLIPVDGREFVVRRILTHTTPPFISP